MKYARFESMKTEHLLLRELRSADVENYFHNLSSSEKVTKYMLWKVHASIQEAGESIEKVVAKYQSGTGYTWGIALAEDDSLIGRIDLLRIDEADETCSFAYMLGEEFWGRGFGTEVLKEIFSFAFEKLGVKSILADHMSENIASGRVMQKAGMRYVRTIPSKYEKDGRIYDADEYEITHDEWSQVKIAFFDLDGTLFENDEDRLSDKTTKALQGLKAKGIRLCLATGRVAIKIPKFEAIDIDAYITFNGSLCYTKDTCIFKDYIPDEDVKILLRNAKEMDKLFSVALESRVMTSRNNTRTIEYYSKSNIALDIVDDFETAIGGEPVYQMMVNCREEEYDRLLKDVKGARITAWSDYAVDVIPVNGNKGAAIKKILKHYGIHPSQAIAFGDSGNDIEMLQTVGCGVAMGNASDKVKAIADDVCRPVSEDGVYYYCVEHGLI